MTGTDTDVGKTYVSCLLLRALNQAGFSTLALKPVAAGCEQNGQGAWCNEDALALQAAASSHLTYEQVNPVALKAAIAPHIAAEQESTPIILDKLITHTQTLQRRQEDFLLIEGAGGWFVPLDANYKFSEYVQRLKLPIILVVDMRLGCLNHALLTASAIEQAGLTLLGWVANNASVQTMQCYAENLATLKTMLKAPCIAEVAHGADLADISIDLSVFENA